MGVPKTKRLATIVVISLDLKEEDLRVLNYSKAMMYFAILDICTTFLQPLTLTLSKYENLTLALTGLVFLLGPMAGLMGVRMLNRSLMAAYAMFCALKLSYQIFLSCLMQFVWLVPLIILQIWISRIAFAFWQSLNQVPSARCNELRHVDARGDVRLVFW